MVKTKLSGHFDIFCDNLWCTVHVFRSVGKFTTDEVDKTAFVRVDLPAFFGDDKTFLGQSFNGNGDKIAVLQNAIAGQNRQGDALLDDIPDA